MKKNRIWGIVLAVLVLFGLTACGAKTGVVSHANYTSIVILENATTESPATTYNGTITLLGTPTDFTNYDGTAKDGYLLWTSEEYSVKVTFQDDTAIAKEQTGLYASIYTTPIGEKTGVWEWIILQLGKFTYFASNLFGLLGDTYIYWIGLLIMTLVVRTLGWPIYAKSNDMTLKMQLAQPDLNKIQEKYAGRQDQASQQRMQMETMEIYKKYKINVLGCLMPFLQMPIFIAMYQVVQRFPLTKESIFGGIDGIMNVGFLWTNLGNTGWLANLPLAIVVGATMWLSQWLTTKRSASTQKNQRYQSAQAQQTAKTMKYMMYFMIIMMAYIAIGNAGIAFYWIVGNCYQLFQGEISHRGMLKKKEQMASKI
jgi:YidC/Oxa1 family membrane protein insertase